MPSLCPECGRVYCDHTPDQRGQTAAEMMREMTVEELEAFQRGSDEQKLEVARRNAHLAGWELIVGQFKALCALEHDPDEVPETWALSPNEYWADQYAKQLTGALSHAGALEALLDILRGNPDEAARLLETAYLYQSNTLRENINALLEDVLLAESGAPFSHYIEDDHSIAGR